MFYFPKRIVFTLLAFTGYLMIFATRVNMSIAMVAMVNSTEDISLNETRLSVPKYNWDTKTQGFILGAFYYGYIITQVPAGMLLKRFGIKWMYAVGILTTTALYLFIPAAVSWNVGALIVIRVIEGLGQGFTLPAMTHGISKWASKSERSRMSSMIFLGLPIGSIIAMPLSGFICSSLQLGGWPTTFYLYGAVGFVWVLFWGLFVYDTPEEHPYISEEELKHIQQNRSEKPPVNAPIPWKDIFSSLPMWAVIIAQFGQNSTFLMFLTETPTYFKAVLKFDIQLNGILSSVPYVVYAIGISLSAVIADKLRELNKLSITTIRKIFNTIGLAGPGLCFLGITASGHDPILVVVFLCLGLFLNGCTASGFNITHVDMSPDFSGILYGITNGIGNVGGFLSPMLVGYLTANGETVENWNKAFYTTAGVYIVTACFFALFASAEVQPWGLAKCDKDTVSKTDKLELSNGTYKSNKETEQI